MTRPLSTLREMVAKVPEFRQHLVRIEDMTEIIIDRATLLALIDYVLADGRSGWRTDVVKATADARKRLRQAGWDASK